MRVYISLFILLAGFGLEAATTIYFTCVPKNLFEPNTFRKVSAEGVIIVDEIAMRNFGKSESIAEISTSGGVLLNHSRIHGTARIENLANLSTLRFFGTKVISQRNDGIAVLVGDGENYSSRVSIGKAPNFQSRFSGEMRCRFSLKPFPRIPNGH